MTTGPHLLLTRPEAASRRFARDMVGANVLISPLSRIEPVAHAKARAKNLVLTSANAVPAAVAIGADLPVYAVGPQTAEAARAEGLTAISAEGTAADLMRLLLRDRPEGLLYLRGERISHDICTELRQAGLTAEEAIVYRAVPTPLSEKAQTLLQSSRPVILPVFSKSTAERLRPDLSVAQNLYPVAISATVSEALGPPWDENTLISATPEGIGMRETVQRQIDTLRRLEGLPPPR
ncbi:uroporphyrinogen-III synthase [Poseidonocella pacifica]|nr:uroporphyrinogen-III synthase [Poseidonocella pacifica]